MAQELCADCKALWIQNLAHYPSVPAGRSYTGKAQPAQCWYHKHNKPLPRNLLEQILTPEKDQKVELMPVPERTPIAPAKVETPAEPEKEKTMDEKKCACGCGAVLDADSPWNYKRGHKPKKNGAAAGTGGRKGSPRASDEPGETAKVYLPESYFDGWWKGLALDEKAALFSQQFESE